jgi:hypothetical protein
MRGSQLRHRVPGRALIGALGVLLALLMGSGIARSSAALAAAGSGHSSQQTLSLPAAHGQQPLSILSPVTVRGLGARHLTTTDGLLPATFLLLGIGALVAMRTPRKPARVRRPTLQRTGRSPPQPGCAWPPLRAS